MLLKTNSHTKLLVNSYLCKIPFLAQVHIKIFRRPPLPKIEDLQFFAFNENSQGLQFP